MPLGNFLYELESCSRYVTHRPNSGLSNGTKIITLGSLEKIGHAYFKKRHPQTPFASYFSNVICVVFGFYSSLELDYPKCKHNKKNPESSLCAYHGTPKAGPDRTCGISGTADTHEYHLELIVKKCIEQRGFSEIVDDDPFVDSYPE